MRGTRLEIKAADGVADSYLVGPEQGEPRAGVLFLIDAFGVRPTTMEMADRIAAEGYLVLMPNTLYRGGTSEQIGMPDFGDEDARGAFMAKIKPLLMEASGEAGGRVGWRIAAAQPDRVAALGCFHTGGLLTDAPDSPHRSAGALRAKLYFGFADRDPSMGAEQIAALEAALDDAGADYRAEVYPGAGHGYTMADTPVFDEAARERHYRELFALLSAAL